ncbi:hypothetical protein ACTFIW_005236 [Dictyostelium discoideum]
MDKIEIEEELICSLAVKGEKSIHKLLLNILAIVKQLKTIQSDPVLTYQVSTKAQQQLQSQQLQQPQSIPSSTTSTTTNTNNSTTTTTTTTISSSASSSSTTPTTSTTSPLNSKDSTTATTTTTTKEQQPSSPTLPTLNLNFVNDNDKIKELNQNCIQSILALQKTIKEISLLETKISQRPKDNIDNDDTIMKDDNNNNNNTSTTTTTNIEKQDQTSLSNELERLKMDAYQKNCVIKKLIDNMRLLQLSINSMNRTSTGTD